MGGGGGEGEGEGEGEGGGGGRCQGSRAGAVGGMRTAVGELGGWGGGWSSKVSQDGHQRSVHYIQDYRGLIKFFHSLYGSLTGCIFAGAAWYCCFLEEHQTCSLFCLCVGFR